jgi:hypothetical protein
VKISVLGKNDLDRLARQLRQAAKVDLPKEMDKGLLDAGDAIGHGIRDATDIYMPRGYEAVFSRSLVIRSTLTRGVQRGVSLVATAFGRRGHPRQVESLEKGLLRHPVFDSSRKRWAKLPQRIRPRWFSEPAKFALPAAIRKLDQAMGRLADKLNNR